MKTLGQGRNQNSWVHPYDRDTTRGEVFGGVSGESVHSSEMKGTVSIAQCHCCGVPFGFPVVDEKNPPRFCMGHRWLERMNPLGVPMLEPIEYVDNGITIRGEGVRWSYFVPEDDPQAAEKYRDGIREWLNETYLEKVGLGRLPKVEIIPLGVKVTGLEWVCWEPKEKTVVDTFLLAEVITQLDRIYVEVL